MFCLRDALVVAVLASGATGSAPPVGDAFGEIVRLADAQMARATTYLSPTEHARSTLASGQWLGKNRNDWTSGFFAGCQWSLYGLTRDPSWRTRAIQQTADLDGLKSVNRSHDLGFQMMTSFGNGYRLTGDPAYRDVLLVAAGTLAQRFDPDVGAIKSWDWKPSTGYQWSYPVILDNMMNLELLLWAADHGGNPAWRDMAISHALVTRRDHVRADASTFHVVDYDDSNGAVLWKGTYQGAADRSTWARGQAWGVYGFTMVYRYTGDPRFLATARRLALTFVARLPPDGIPYWDFDAPGIPNEPRDSSAAAVALAGLLELLDRPLPAADRPLLEQAAGRIFATLYASYLERSGNSDGVLLQGVGNKPAGSEVGVSLIYGDYYFLEALRRLQDYRPIR